MALAQVNQIVEMLGKTDQLSKLVGGPSGISTKIGELYESVAHVKYGRKDPASRALTVGSQFALGTMALVITSKAYVPLYH